MTQIEQNHAWSEKDQQMFIGVMSIVRDWIDNTSEKEKAYYDDCGYMDWIKSLKERVKGRTMTTPITSKWLLAHGFSRIKDSYGRYEASLPNTVDSITIFLYNGTDSIDFWVESDDMYINGTLREGTAEELQKYIDVCDLSEEFLDAYRLNKKGEGNE